MNGCRAKVLEFLLFRRAGGLVQFLLVHPGGPFWSKKDEHL